MFTESNSKCNNCKFTLSNTCKQTIKDAPTIIKQKGRNPTEILFLFEMPENQSMIDKFEKLLYNNGIGNYTLANAIGCQTKDFSFPGSVTSSYESCGRLKDIQLDKYNTIVPIGRALFAITQSDDIISWEEFVEFLFNDTFFYTPYELNKRTGKKIRIYPLPPLVAFIDRDNFNHFFVEKQLKFVKEFLKLKIVEKFDNPELVMIQDTNDFFNKTIHIQKIAWDTETNSLNHFAPDFKVGCITVSFDGKTGYYLPFEKINRRRLTQYFRDRYHIGANLKYDNKAMRRMGINSSTYDEDVILLFHVLNTTKTKVGLKTIAWQLGFGGYDEPLEQYKKTHKVTNYLDIPEPILFDYATLDAIVTYRTYDYLRQIAQRQIAQYKMYKDILLPALPVFEKAELYGIKVNKEYLNRLDDYLFDQKQKAKSDLFEEAGREFDPESNEEIAKIFEQLGLPCLGRTKKGVYQTGKNKIDEWVKNGYTIAKKLMNYRKAAKMISSFGGRLDNESHISIEENDITDSLFSGNNFIETEFGLDDANEDMSQIGIAQHVQYDGRVHPDYKFALQYTFRSADPQPGLTRMPKKGKEGEIFRPVLSPDPDFYFGEIDYSGLQLRITAGFSQDPVMNEIFTTGHGDMHSDSAQAIFMKDISVDEFIKRKKEKEFKAKRDKAKGEINFALIFSDGYYVLVTPIKNNWTQEEINNHFSSMPDENKIFNKDGDVIVINSVANDIFVKFMDRYKRVGPYIKERHDEAMKNGYIDSIFGGRRHLPWLFYIGKPNYEEQKKISNLKNISVNSAAQIAEALLMYKAMAKLDNLIVKHKLKSRIVGMIHDAIPTLDHKDELEIMAKLKIEAMNDYQTFSVPLLAEIDNGPVLGFGAELNSEWNLEKMIDTVESSYKKFKENHELLKNIV